MCIRDRCRAVCFRSILVHLWPSVRSCRMPYTQKNHPSLRRMVSLGGRLHIPLSSSSTGVPQRLQKRSAGISGLPHVRQSRGVSSDEGLGAEGCLCAGGVAARVRFRGCAVIGGNSRRSCSMRACRRRCCIQMRRPTIPYPINRPAGTP